MAKPSEQSFYDRLNFIAGSKKSINENNENGTLIDSQKSNEGTNYGIVKENHHYYIKKSSTMNENLDASDFAYIGGLENKHLYEYKSLHEAEKQRNMYIKSLNEAFSLKPTKIMNESKKIEKVENPFEFLRSRINEGKSTNKKKFENQLKSSLKENIVESTKKRGLMPEAADVAVKKALGILTEEAITTEDSEVKKGDILPDKKGKEKPQAPINDANAKKEAEKAMGKDKSDYVSVPDGSGTLSVNQQGKTLKEESSPLVTDDSELIADQSLANDTNQKHEKPQAPINDANAKAIADKATGGQGTASLPNNAEEQPESDPLDDKEDAGDEKGDIVTEAKAISTEDSDQKDADVIADATGHEKPEAPYNSYNQPEKGQKEEKGEELKPKASKKDIVAEEKALSTEDSEIKTGDSLVNKTSEPAKGSGKSEIVADSELKPKDSLANKTKTKLPNPIAEAAEALDDLTETDSSLIYADSPEVGKDSLANDTKTNLPNPVAEAEGDGIDQELDAAANALDSIETAPAPEPEVPAPIDDMPDGGEMPTGDDPMAGMDADPLAGGEEGGDMGADPMAGGDMGADPLADPIGGEEGGETANDDLKNEVKSKVGEIGELVRDVNFENSDIVELINQMVEPFDTESLSHNEQLKIQNKLTGEEGAGEDLPPEVEPEGGEEMAVDAEIDAVQPGMGDEEVVESGNMKGVRPWEKDELDKNYVRQQHKDTGEENVTVQQLNKQAIEDPNPLNMEEEECSECGPFDGYAKSRGYEDVGTAGGMELANLLSGYASAHGEGQNDGDFAKVVILLTPEVRDELSGYGHDDFMAKADEFGSEVSDEETLSPGSFDIEVPSEPEGEEAEDLEDAGEEVADIETGGKKSEDGPIDEAEQIDELGWRDIKNVGAGLAGVGQKAGQKIGDKLGQAQQGVAGAMQKGVDAVAGAAEKAGQYIGDKAKGVQQTYHKSGANRMVSDIQQDAAKLGDTIAKFNAKATKAGQQPIPVQSIMMQINNQIKKGGDVNLQNRRFEGLGEGGEDFAPDNWLPNGWSKDLTTSGEEYYDEQGVQHDYRDVMKKWIELNNGGSQQPVVEFAPIAQTLGVVGGKIGENEIKVRNYVKNKLEELAGKRKPTMNESDKPANLKKLDKMINDQWNLYRKEVKNKINA